MHLRSGNQESAAWLVTSIWRGLLPKLMPVMFPVFALLAYFGEGEWLLLLTAASTPIVFMLLNRNMGTAEPARNKLDSITGLINKAGFEAEMVEIMGRVKANETNTACLMILLDDFHEVSERYGEAAAEQTLHSIAKRLELAVRDCDVASRLGTNRFAVMLGEVRRLDLEVCIQLSRRLQAAVEEPVLLDGINVYVSCCIGFCLATRSEEQTAASLLASATIALDEAHRHAPSAIRAYSRDMERKASTRQKMMNEARSALGKGQLHAWFQPQVSTDTGRITGFEALVRWEHPTRGVIPPGEFLESLEMAGQLEGLSDIMLDQALTAQKAWDEAGFNVPCIGVNFAKDELRNPKLIDKVAWKLDQFDIEPERLVIEVLETVVSGSPEDIVARNINGLAKLGCQIDLDDFGTGHASISSIRRFTVSRIKIDRSFVMKSDQDPEQQRLIHAIITMAERLGLETLAEGVETTGEHTILAQLGCGHVQGYGIARPMRFGDTIGWMRQHNSKLENPPEIGRKTG